MPDRPTAGQLEERALDLTVDGRRIRGRIPYGIESRDMGGWREVIEPTALRGVDLDQLVATVDHVGIPIGPRTLEIEERDDGLHWSVEPPASRRDVVEAVGRGDLQGGSWRMRVARDEWRGDVRHIHEIAELRDVAVVTNPAYPAAVVEMRNHDPAEAEEDSTMAETAEKTTETATASETTEERSAPTTGGLQVEHRVTVTATRDRGLADEFRAAGFPGETATIPWKSFEARAVTWTGSVDNINKVQATAGPLGADQRYAWPAFQRVPVDSAATSVDVFTRTARTLASAANVVRAIDAVSAKPETASTLTSSLPRSSRSRRSTPTSRTSSSSSRPSTLSSRTTSRWRSTTASTSSSSTSSPWVPGRDRTRGHKRWSTEPAPTGGAPEQGQTATPRPRTRRRPAATVARPPGSSGSRRG